MEIERKKKNRDNSNSETEKNEFNEYKFWCMEIRKS